MKYHHIKIFVFFLLVSFISSCQPSPSEHYVNAEKLYQNEKYLEALDEIELVASSNEANFLKAKIHSQLDEYDKAIDIYQSLDSKNFKRDTVNAYLADVYKSKAFAKSMEADDSGNPFYKKCIIAAEVAIGLNRNYLDAFKSKSIALYNLERNKENIVFLNLAIKRFPDSQDLIFYKGLSKFGLNDFVGVVEIMSQIIETEYDDDLRAPAYRFRGLALREQEKYNSAIEDYTKSIELEEFGYTYYNRASAYRANYDIPRNKRKEKACTDYRKAADLGVMLAFDAIREYCN